MDGFSVLFFLLVVFFYAIGMSRRASLRARRGSTEQARRTRDIKDALGKIHGALELFRSDLDPDKLRAGNEHYTHYYCGYIFSMAKTIASYHRVEFSVDIRLPVLLEVSRLCGQLTDYEEGERLLEEVLETNYGKAGVEDGVEDTGRALSPGFEGPYWEQLDRYFNG